MNSVGFLPNNIANHLYSMTFAKLQMAHCMTHHISLRSSCVEVVNEVVDKAVFEVEAGVEVVFEDEVKAVWRLRLWLRL